jgi:hypothetical protein
VRRTGGGGAVPIFRRGGTGYDPSIGVCLTTPSIPDIVLRSLAFPARRATPSKVAGWPLAVLLVIAFTGCSGDDDTGGATTLLPPSSAAVVETTVETTVVPVPVTAGSASPTTSPPPTVSTAAPDSSLPATTEPSTPSQDEAEQDVIEAAIASWTAFNELLLDPGNDDLLAAVALTRTGAALDRAIDVIVGYRARNEAERTLTDFPAKIDVIRDSVLIDLDAGSAALEYCRLGSNIWVEIGANQDGSDRVLNDEVNSYLETAMFELVDGGWMKTDGMTKAKYEGELACPAE